MWLANNTSAIGLRAHTGARIFRRVRPTNAVTEWMRNVMRGLLVVVVALFELGGAPTGCTIIGVSDIIDINQSDPPRHLDSGSRPTGAGHEQIR
jgi:hypothetical protein